MRRIGTETSAKPDETADGDADEAVAGASDVLPFSIIGRFGELAGLDDDPLDPFGPLMLRTPSALSWSALGST